jgi:uncharacterized protein YcgI (DUF1989 family)
MTQSVTIPGARARALPLKCGEQLRIINLEGSQVVDAWAFRANQPEEYLSTEHTRSCLEKLIPCVGDALYSNRRRPILRITEDTSPGVHDLLLSACDRERYRLPARTIHEGARISRRELFSQQLLRPHRILTDICKRARFVVGTRIKREIVNFVNSSGYVSMAIIAIAPTTFARRLANWM